MIGETGGAGGGNARLRSHPQSAVVPSSDP
jgi:hypothetical protein